MPIAIDQPSIAVLPRHCVRVREATADDIAVLADIHTEGMPWDFMVRLGRMFQTKVLFPTTLTSPGSRVYVAEHRDGVGGFLITCRGSRGTVSQMLRRHPIWFLVSCFAAAIRRPTILLQALSVLAQLRARRAEPEAPASAELFLMAVAGRARRRGLGRALVEHSAAQLQADGVETYRVWLHAHNALANRLYQSTGFDRERTFDFAGQRWRQREMLLRPVSTETRP